MTPIQAGLKKNEGCVYKNLIDKRKKITPNVQINDLVRTADLKKTFPKGDTTNWSYKLYKISENINDIIPSYRIDNLPESYNESLLKKTELSMKENKCYEKIELKLDQTFVAHRCLSKLVCLLKLKHNRLYQWGLLHQI